MVCTVLFSGATLKLVSDQRMIMGMHIISQFGKVVSVRATTHELANICLVDHVPEECKG